MEYVIGIDGGGTKSLLHMADGDGNPILELSGGPLNLNATGKQAVEVELKKLLFRAADNSGMLLTDCRAFCLGAAGADRSGEREIFESILRGLGVRGAIEVTNDAENALAAGSGSREGVVVIAGTGSLAFGRDGYGNVCRSGGWGHLVGDEGSGYAIASRAVAASLRSFDDREPYTELLPRLMEETGINSPEQFIPFIYRQEGKRHIAALARVVNEAFLAGDRKAEFILIEAADELALMARTVIGKLRFDSSRIPLVCSGGVFSSIDAVFERFVRQVTATGLPIEVIKPVHNAAYGAAKIALLISSREGNG
ncbi:BadF/BadG/BcrA/BcrD ATPase family protein [Cohnella sp.]|uniref:BadF/BadG/BcrA/BcrD ATPase family protein n=1 Tax=Cohnella sp. TaxID=1883426 RepID=UPI00356B15B5